MTTPVTKYFGGSKGGGKRNLSSTSSATSDSASSPSVSDKSKQTQVLKKQKKDRGGDKKTEVDMELKDTLQEIKDKMVTKDDIQTLKNEMTRLMETLTARMDLLETKLFDVQTENDKLKSDVKKLMGEKTELKDELSQRSKEINNLKCDLNDNEQHGRQWNIRVYGIPECQEETVDDCIKKCVGVFNKQLDVKSVSTSHVEIAHRAGKKGVGSRPRPILLRFLSRRQRGEVLVARRKLKGSGISISEDLTQANYQLLKRVSDHSATMSAWTSNGKVLSKLKNGKIVRVDVDTNIDSLFRREMN